MSLAIIFDITTLFVILLMRLHQTFPQRIFLHILVANLGEYSVDQMDDGNPGAWCALLGFLCQVFSSVVFLWISGLTVYLVLALHVYQRNHQRQWTYVLVCWGVPLLVAFIPLTTDDYGPAGGFCWIKGSDAWGHIWRLALWWGPASIAMVVVLITFIILHYKAFKQIRLAESADQLPQQRQKVNDCLKPLTIYAAVTIVMYICMVIDRLYTLANPANPTLRLIQITIYGSHGIVLCSMFYILSAKQEFTMVKLHAALEQHKAFFMRISVGKQKFEINRNEKTQVWTEVYSIGETHLQRPGSPPFELSGKSRRSKKDRRAKTENSTPTLIFTLQPLPEEPTPCPPTVWLTPPSSWKPSLTLTDRTRLNTKTESREVVLQPTYVAKDSLNLRYELDRNREMVNVFIGKVNGRKEWLLWKDDETVRMWKKRMRQSANIPGVSSKGFKLRICDQDGSEFTDDISWSQIKSVSSSVTIIINGGITEVRFIPELSTEKTMESESEQA